MFAYNIFEISEQTFLLLEEIMDNSRNKGFDFYKLMIDVLLAFIIYIICFAIFI